MARTRKLPDDDGGEIRKVKESPLQWLKEAGLDVSAMANDAAGMLGRNPLAKDAVIGQLLGKYHVLKALEEHALKVMREGL